MTDKLPEDKQTYWTRACSWAKGYTGHPNLRCSHCPFKDCYKDNPWKVRGYFIERIATLKTLLDKLDGIGYTEPKSMDYLAKRGK